MKKLKVNVSPQKQLQLFCKEEQSDKKKKKKKKKNQECSAQSTQQRHKKSNWRISSNKVMFWDESRRSSKQTKKHFSMSAELFEDNNGGKNIDLL